jgi:hypothetical protein
MDPESQPHDISLNSEQSENVEFAPLYDLSEQDYQSIIHRLVDAVVDAVGSMRHDGQLDNAGELANRVNEILLDYDDDVAERVWMAAFGQEESAEKSGLGAARDSFLL